MKKVCLVVSSLGLALLGGCASTASVKPVYVSPAQYQSLSCTQLQSEYNRIHRYAESGVEPETRTGMGVGFGLGGGWGRHGGWGVVPSISVNLGQSSTSKRTELARILGQQEAVAQAAQFKGCPMLIRQRTQA